jgi:transcriptional regulator with XRE-family HTH domain
MATPREQLADLLKQARIEAGYGSHGALAKKLNVSRSVVTKAESAAHPVPSDGLLASWAGVTGVALDKLTELAQRAKSGTPEWFMPYRQAEAEAGILRCWSPLLIPGLLQIPEYAHALFVATGDDAKSAAEKVSVRLERQTILDRPDPPHLVVVIDETATRRLIGTAAIMADQLAHVAGMAERLHVSVHVLPATGANAGLSGAFDLASADGSMDTLRMEGIEDQTTENRALVRKANILFDLVRRDALPRIPSRDLIQKVAGEWKTAA